MSSLSKISRLGMSAVFMGVAMFMSSCSKEEVKAPEPQADRKTLHSSSSDSNAKTDDLTPSIPKTTGLACKGCQAVGWTNVNWNPDVPTGTSTPSKLWGDDNFPWINSLRSTPDATSFLTVSSVDFKGGGGANSRVYSMISNLIPGKKYALTFKVSTTRTWNSNYAKSVGVTLYHFNAPTEYIDFDLSNTPAQWINKTIIFTADNNKAEVSFGIEESDVLAYANICVGPNAIKKLN